MGIGADGFSRFFFFSPITDNGAPMLTWKVASSLHAPYWMAKNASVQEIAIKDVWPSAEWRRKRLERKGRLAARCVWLREDQPGNSGLGDRWSATLMTTRHARMDFWIASSICQRATLLVRTL